MDCNCLRCNVSSIFAHSGELRAPGLNRSFKRKRADDFGTTSIDVLIPTIFITTIYLEKSNDQVCRIGGFAVRSLYSFRSACRRAGLRKEALAIGYMLGMTECSYMELNAKDKLLNAEYKVVMANRDAKQRKQLRSVQS